MPRVTRFAAPVYRADIDGLRAVAVIAVIAFHAFPGKVPGGYVGVDIFFVISGYLISGQILHRLERGDFRFAEFYTRRIRRIVPALVLVLGACYAAGWFALFAGEFAALSKHIAAGAAFLSNLAPWRESGYFDSSSALKPLLHLWSLGVEEQFYVLWPVLLFLAFRLRFKVLALTLAVLLASFAANVFELGPDPSGAFYLPFARFWELMAGSALVCLRPWKDSVRGAAACAGIVIIGGSLMLLGSAGQAAELGVWWPVLGAVLLIMAGPGTWVNRKLLAFPLLVSIGLISYPLYLWHWPLLSFANIVESGLPAVKIRLGAVAASFALAFLTYRLVERPIRSGGGSRIPALVSAFLLAAAGVAGLMTWRDNGAPFRKANRGSAQAADVVLPGPTLVSDFSCVVKLEMKQIGNEVCLTMSVQPEILILGDSHAIALNSAAFLKKVPLNTMLIAANTCLPFTGYISYGPSEKPDGKICAEVARQMLGAAGRQAEARTVILSTRGPIYFAGHAFGIEMQDSGLENWKMEATAEGEKGLPLQESFLRGFSRMIGDLERMGKTVIFMIDVPELGFDPHQCVSGRPFTFSARLVSPCTLPRRLVEERQADYRKLVASLQAQHPGLKVFDPLPLFCDGQVCRAKDDSHIFYYDTNHLSVSGSQRVLTALLPLLSPPH